MSEFHIELAFRHDEEGRLLCDATNMQGSRESVTFEVEPPRPPLRVEVAEAERHSNAAVTLILGCVLIVIVTSWPVQAFVVAVVAAILWLIKRPLRALAALFGATLAT